MLKARNSLKCCSARPGDTTSVIPTFPLSPLLSVLGLARELHSRGISTYLHLGIDTLCIARRAELIPRQAEARLTQLSHNLNEIS